MRKKVLLTSVCRPLGPKYGEAPSVGYELLHGQVTRAQGMFSPRAVHVQFSLDYIAENLDAPTVVLHYPSMRELDGHAGDVGQEAHVAMAVAAALDGGHGLLEIGQGEPRPALDFQPRAAKNLGADGRDGIRNQDSLGAHAASTSSMTFSKASTPSGVCSPRAAMRSIRDSGCWSREAVRNRRGHDKRSGLGPLLLSSILGLALTSWLSVSRRKSSPPRA